MAASSAAAALPLIPASCATRSAPRPDGLPHPRLPAGLPGVRAVIEEEPVHVLIPASSGAGGQVEHGPRGRAVLVGHLRQLAGVALPPSARVAAGQGAGQPGGQRGVITCRTRWRCAAGAARTICRNRTICV